MFRKLKEVVFYFVFLLVVVTVVVEVSMRFLFPAAQRHFIFPPHMNVVFYPNDDATPGVTGPGRFMTNSLGMRSNEPPTDRRITIYVFGGSTAADTYLDQDEAWVQLLEANLNAVPNWPLTWVGNLSRSSMATLHNLLMFSYLIPELPKADLFISLVGVNDMQLALKTSYLRDMTIEQHLSWTFSEMPASLNLFDGLAVVRFTRHMFAKHKKSRFGVTQEFDASGFSEWRRCRQTAPADRLVHELPDFNNFLKQYVININQLIDRAADLGVPWIFMTQPTLWAEDMDWSDAKLLLAGGIGPNNEWCEKQQYYSPRALCRGIDYFNNALLDVCRERKVICIDLANMVPKTRSYFYDDMHFNEAGARLVSELVAQAVRDFMSNKMNP